MPGISRKAALAVAASASLALLATACTGQAETGASDDPDAETTITFWHGWSAPPRSRPCRPTWTGSRRRTPTSR